MRLKIVVSILFIIHNFIVVNAQHFDKSLFYKAIALEDVDRVDEQLNILKSSSITGKEAFEGTLLMKKAGLVHNPKKKLSLFKSGHQDLEKAINKDRDNAEFRFLRLLIQENAPGILNYNDDLKKDSEYIRKSFKSLSPVVQDAIRDYSKKSKILNPSDFKLVN
jgi:hypothetical protein